MAVSPHVNSIVRRFFVKLRFVTSEIRKLLAYHYIGIVDFEYIGFVTSDDFIAWAVSMLEAGFDSKNIRILAGLTEPLYFSEVEEYLRRSFKDLGWHFPTQEEALRLYACDVAESITSEIMFPEKGCREMHKICAALGNPQDLEVWRALDMELLIIENNDFKPGYGGEIDGQIILEARKYKAAWCG